MFVREIIAEVADEYLIFPSDIVGYRRVSNIVQARQKAMWRARRETNSSYLKLARIFKRDHSTVIYSVKCWDAKLRGDKYDRAR